MAKSDAAEAALLEHARAIAKECATQGDLVAQAGIFALERGYSQMIAERMARYVWDSRPAK